MRRAYVRAGFATIMAAALLVFAALEVQSGVGRAVAATGEGMDPLFPAFPGTQLFGMGSGDMNGEPWKLAYFTAQATPEEVVRFYDSFWKAKKLMVDGDGNDSSAHVAALDGVDGVMRSVTLHREGDRVVAFCSISQPGKSVAKASGASDTLPSFEGSLIDESMNIDGAATRVLMFPGDLAAVRKDLITRFEGKGWVTLPEQTRGSPHGLVLQFKRAGYYAQAALVKESQERAVAVQIHTASQTVADGSAQ